MPSLPRRSYPTILALALAALLSGVAALPAAAHAPGAGQPAAAHAKLSGRLAWLAARPQRGAEAAALELPTEGPGSLLRDSAGRVLVYLTMRGVGAPEQVALEAAGARVVHVSDEYRVITAAVAARDLARIAGLPGVLRAQEALAPGRRSAPAPATGAAQAAPACPGGAVVSEGDTALGAAAARARFGLDGSHITVGVLADSFDVARGAPRAAADIATGDLPGPGNPCGRAEPVNVLAEPRLGSGRDEGRAMLQIVHDLAPGARLAFATAADGLYAYADNIRRLRWAAGADVIVDDYYYPEEPFFQDGPVSVAIADVVADGAVYVTAGGNINVNDPQGRPIGSYEAAAYRPVACPALVDGAGQPVAAGVDCHDFDPGRGDDPGIDITLPAGAGVVINFQWSEPWFGVATDLDIYLASEDGVIVAQSTGVLGPAPFEFFSYINEGDAPQVVQLVAARFTGGSPRLKFTLGSAALRVAPPSALEYADRDGPDIFGPTSGDHGIAPGAISVGAAPADDPLRPEPFSSLGPALVYWAPASSIRPASALPAPELRAKPDVAATDGVRTTFYGFTELGGPRCDAAAGTICRFYGTSAAAPHVAGVAALLAERSLRADVLLDAGLAMQVLRAGARPMQGPAGAYGAGLVNAESALAALEAALADPALAGPLMPDLAGLNEQAARKKLLAAGVAHDRIVADYQDRAKLGAAFERFPAFAVVSTVPRPGVRIGSRGNVVLGVRAPEP